jgi:hypothetical protein
MSNIEVKTSPGNGVTRTLIENGKILQIRVPIQYKHRQGRRQIVVVPPPTEGDRAVGRSVENDKLVLAIARAHRWLELIDSGEVASITELASRLNLDISYVNRLIRFALLAPDIAESILDGNEPDGLSMAKLRNGFPDLWEQQAIILVLTGTACKPLEAKDVEALAV